MTFSGSLPNNRLGVGLPWHHYMVTRTEAGATDVLYMAGFPTNLNSTTVPTVGTLVAMPFVSGPGGLVDEVGFNIATIATAGGVARCGIYDNDETRGLFPTALLFEPGADIATDGSTGFKFHVPNPMVRMERNRVYWCAFFCGVAAPTMTGLSGDSPAMGFSRSISAQFGYQKTGLTYGALPTVFPATAQVTASSQPAVFVAFNTIFRTGLINRIWGEDD